MKSIVKDFNIKLLIANVAMSFIFLTYTMFKKTNKKLLLIKIL